MVKNDKFINGKEITNSSIKHNWAKSNEVKEYFKWCLPLSKISMYGIALN